MLADPVKAALLDPPPGERTRVVLAGTPFSVLHWGRVGDPTVLLLHGARGSARVWWRVGPAIAASGRHVVAPDLPGHGHTPATTHLAGFDDLAAALAALPGAMGLTGPVDVIGTSWGAMVASRIPGTGLAPGTLVVVEPPVLSAEPREMAAQLAERPGATLDETLERVAEWHPDWEPQERLVKAENLMRLDMDMLRAVQAANTAWDGGLASLRDAQQRGVAVWIVRGNPALGGLTSDSFVAQAQNFVLGGRIVQIPTAGHVPQRTDPARLVEICLAALDGAAPPPTELS